MLDVKDTVTKWLRSVCPSSNLAQSSFRRCHGCHLTLHVLACGCRAEVVAEEMRYIPDLPGERKADKPTGTKFVRVHFLGW